MAKKKSAVKVPVEEFLVTLRFLKGFAAQDKADRAALAAAYFSEDGSIRVNSLVLGAECRTAWRVGAFAAPVDRLVAALTSAHAQGVAEAELEVSESNLLWRAGSARGRIALVADPIDQFPGVPDAPAPVEVGEVFRLALARAEPFVARDDRFPSLRGAYWSADGSVVACDGVRMTSVRAGGTGLGCLVPDVLLRAVGDRPLSSALLGENVVWLGDDACRAYGRLYEAEFPHARFAGIFADLSTRAAAGALPRFALKADQPVAALLKTVAAAAEAPLHECRVDVSAGAVDVWCESEAGEARVRLGAETSGPPAQFRVNARYLADAARFDLPAYVTENVLYAADDQRVVQHAVMLLAQ